MEVVSTHVHHMRAVENGGSIIRQYDEIIVSLSRKRSHGLSRQMAHIQKNLHIVCEYLKVYIYLFLYVLNALSGAGLGVQLSQRMTRRCYNDQLK